MRIAGTEINLKYKAFEIYVSGCREAHCSGCHNPELWSFDIGDPYPSKEVQDRLAWQLSELKQAKLIDSIWLLGGEPLDQDQEKLKLLLKYLKETGLSIVLWTHYETIADELKCFVDYIKTGRYNEQGKSYIEPVLGIALANREQKITKLG